MDKEQKKEQIKEIIRLRLIEGCTYQKIMDNLKITRPTAIKYIKKFENVIPKDLLDRHIDKNKKRRDKSFFPICWNKYVDLISADWANHPEKGYLEWSASIDKFEMKHKYKKITE